MMATVIRNTLNIPLRIRDYYAAARPTIKVSLDPLDSRTAITIKDWVSALIVLVTSGTTAFLPLGKFKQLIEGGGSKEGVAQPTIFPRLSSTTAYHVFVVSIMFAFSSAFSAMFLGKKPRAARALRFSAIIWLSSAFVLLILAIFFNGLN